MASSIRNWGSSSSDVFRPSIDRSLIPDPLIVRCGRPVTLSLAIRANPAPALSCYVGSRLISPSQSDEYQTTSVPPQQPASASTADAVGDNPDRFLHRFSLRISRASSELHRGIFVRASNTAGDDCCFLRFRTYAVLEGRSKSSVDLPNNESKETERKLLKYYRKISFGSVEDQIRWTTMMEERNRMRSVDDVLDARMSTGSPSGRHRLQGPSDDQEGTRPQHQQSPRADFHTEVIFENVCLPSPLLSSSRLTPSGRRKTLPGTSPLTPCKTFWDKHLTNAETSQREVVSHGNGGCRQEDGFSGSDELLVDVDTKFRGGTDEPSGENCVEIFALGPTSPSEAINRGAVISRCSRRTHANRSGGSDVSTAFGCCDAKAQMNADAKAQMNADAKAQMNADAKAKMNADANATAGDRRTSADDNAAGHLASGTSVQSTKNQNPARMLLITDLDAFDDDPIAPATISIDAPSTGNSSSSSGKVGQQAFSIVPEVLWEVRGRKLSNFCQTLITDCGRFAGQTQSLNDALVKPATTSCADSAIATTVDPTGRQNEPQSTIDDGQIFPVLPPGNLEPSTNSEISCSLLAEKNGDASRLGRRDSNDVGSRFMEAEMSTGHNYSPCINADKRRLDFGIDSCAVDLNKQESDWSFGIRSIPASPLRYAPRGTSSLAHVTEEMTKARSVPSNNTQGTGKVSLETAADTKDEAHSKKKGFDEGGKAPENVKTVGRPEEDKTSVFRSAGRRGRTMERGNYDAGLLKDFIKPEFKKFSLPPSSQDLDLDTELAIWEPSDFVPERHQSAPPADTTIKIAKSDDLLLRSRQASVSPLRTRILGPNSLPRSIRGSKSVEILKSRNASPGGARIRRRALSKEWQIVTLTTREEITTTIRPKSERNGLQSSAENFSTESNISLNSVFSLRNGGLGAEYLPTFSEGDQFKFNASDVRGADVRADAECNVEERNFHGKAWNAETNDLSQEEIGITYPLHAQLWNIQKPGSDTHKSISGIDNQACVVTTNAKQQDNGDTTPTGVENLKQTSGEIAGLEAGSDAQLQSAHVASTACAFIPPKIGIDDKDRTACDELPSALTSAENPEPLDLVSNNTQSPGEVAFWTIISEALSEMMKEVELAESGSSATEVTAATVNDSQDKNELKPNFGSAVCGSDSFRTVENADSAGNLLVSDSFEDFENPDASGAEIDALVQALLHFANEGATVESLKTSSSQTAVESSQSTTKDSTHKIVRVVDEGLPPASAWPQNRSDETTITNNFESEFRPTGSDEGILETYCNSCSYPTRTKARQGLVGFDEENNTSAVNFLTPKLKDSVDTTDVFNCDFSVQDADSESVLEIREESDELDTAKAELHSRFPVPPDGDKPTPDDSSLSDSLKKKTFACADDTVRRRMVSKQDVPPEVTLPRRRSDSGDVFPEKAFLESLFSSLGTIIFLLLAALIFHVLSQIVEHEP